MKKIRGKLGLYAKEREEFEIKKKQLEEEMSKGKQNMDKIRRGFKLDDGSEEEITIKRTKSSRIRPDTTEQLKSPPIPTGPKISDWCYRINDENTSPPLLKTQEMYEEVRFLGRGSFGNVDLVKNREENKLYAAKTVMLQNSQEEELSLNEVKYLRQYRHPFIINIHDVFICAQPRKLFIVLNYCEGGDLGKTVMAAKRNHTIIQEIQIVKWMTQVGLALSYLHSCNVVHRDVKLVNILLSDNGEVALLADFGLATDLSNLNQKVKVDEVGTPYYTSPEIINNEPCDISVDCWAFGVCLYELMSLRLPFQGESTVALVKSILQDPLQLSNIPNNYSPDLISTLEGLLVKDPKNRYSINNFLTSPVILLRLPQVPSSYRPKQLEERLRRFHVRQISNQLEKLGINLAFPTPGTSRQPSLHFSINETSNSDVNFSLTDEEEKNTLINSVTTLNPLVSSPNIHDSDKKLSIPSPSSVSVSVSSSSSIQSSNISQLPVVTISPKKISSNTNEQLNLGNDTLITPQYSVMSPRLPSHNQMNQITTTISTNLSSTDTDSNEQHVDRSVMKTFKELSISNISVTCASKEDNFRNLLPDVQVSDDLIILDGSINQIIGNENEKIEFNKIEDIDLLATSKINILEQADNYLRKHQQQEQQNQQQIQISEQQQQQQQVINSKQQSIPSGLSLMLETQGNEQVQLAPISTSPGGSVSTSPRMFNLRYSPGSSQNTIGNNNININNNIGNNNNNNNNNNITNYLVPGVPTSARNPSNVISPLTRTRTTTVVASSPNSNNMSINIASSPSSLTSGIATTPIMATTTTTTLSPVILNGTNLSISTSPHSPSELISISPQSQIIHLEPTTVSPILQLGNNNNTNNNNGNNNNNNGNGNNSPSINSSTIVLIPISTSHPVSNCGTSSNMVPITLPSLNLTNSSSS